MPQSPAPPTRDRSYENSTQIALRKSSLPKLPAFFRRISSPTTATLSTTQASAKAQAASQPRHSTAGITPSTTNDANRASSVSTLGSLPPTAEEAADEDFVYKQIMRHHTPITLTPKEAKKLAKAQAKAYEKAMKLQRGLEEKERKRAS